MRAARYQRNVNPVQNALGLKGTQQWMNGVRNYAAYTRDKPHVNIGMCIHIRLCKYQLIETQEPLVTSITERYSNT